MREKVRQLGCVSPHKQRIITYGLQVHSSAQMSLLESSPAGRWDPCYSSIDFANLAVVNASGASSLVDALCQPVACAAYSQSAPSCNNHDVVLELIDSFGIWTTLHMNNTEDHPAHEQYSTCGSFVVECEEDAG